MEKTQAKAAIEAISFSFGESVEWSKIASAIDLDKDVTDSYIRELMDEYEKEDRGITLKLLGNKYKLVTKAQNKEYIKKLTEEVSNTLSKSALETLAIIAYNEPITRIAVDEIRGVNSSQMIRNLVSKGFIVEDGKSDLPGKPNLYKTTNYFLDYFNLSSIDELPKIDMDDIEVLEDDDLFNTRYKEEIIKEEVGE